MPLTRELKGDMDALAIMIAKDAETSDVINEVTRETNFGNDSQMPPVLKRRNAISPRHFENSEAASRLFK